MIAPTSFQAGQLVPYRKSHLCPTESALFAAGTELVVAPPPAGWA